MLRDPLLGVLSGHFYTFKEKVHETVLSVASVEPVPNLFLCSVRFTRSLMLLSLDISASELAFLSDSLSRSLRVLCRLTPHLFVTIIGD